MEITETLLLKDSPCTLRDRAGDQHGDSLASPVHLVEIVPQLPDLLADVPGKELALRFDHQLEFLVVEPHLEQSTRGIARADALLPGALLHGSARQRRYGTDHLPHPSAFLKPTNSHFRSPAPNSLIYTTQH